MPAPDLCTITGTAYKSTGEVQTDAHIDIVKVYLNGSLISSNVQQIPAGAGDLDPGEFEFTLPRGAIAYIRGNIIGINTATNGHAIEIPDADTATLESLLPLHSISISGVSRGDLEEAVEEALEDFSGGTGETLLSTTPLFNLAVDTWQDLYTVPVGKICFPTMTVVTDSTTDLGESEVGGFECRESSSASDIQINGSLGTLIAAGDYAAFRVGTNRSRRVAAGNKIQGRVGAAHTGGAATVTVLLFGVLIDA